LKNKMMEMLYTKKQPFFGLSDELLNKYTFEKTASRILLEFGT